MPRILIVTDGPPAADIATTNLMTRDGHEWEVADAFKANSVMHSWRPHVVVADITAPDTDVAAFIAKIRDDESAEGQAPLIVLAPELSLSQRVAVLRAGAKECIVKPVSPPELMRHIAKLLKQVNVEEIKEKPALGRIVAVYGAKGGAGATTVAVNTAFALQRLTGERICLFDANFQFGDHRIFLDLVMSQASIEDIIAAGVSGESVLANLIHHTGNVDLLLAPRTPEYADLVTPEAASAILEQLRSRFDYVVVDVERHLGERALQLLDLADVVCLVTTSDLPALKNMRLILDMLRELGFDAERLRLLLNHSGAATGINSGEVETSLGRKIDYRISNDDQGEREAINAGRPTMLSRPDSHLGLEFTHLAKSLRDLAPIVRTSTFKQTAEPRSKEVEPFVWPQD